MFISLIYKIPMNVSDTLLTLTLTTTNIQPLEVFEQIQ